jgi:hypothetical protein
MIVTKRRSGLAPSSNRKRMVRMATQRAAILRVFVEAAEQIETR